MRSRTATAPYRHLLEHGAIVVVLAVLTIWWWWAVKGDSFRQFGSFVSLAEIIDHPADGIGFPTLMLSSDRATGWIGAFFQCLLFVLAALFWMHGPVWVAIAMAGPIRHKLESQKPATTSYDDARLALSFRRALPEYTVAAAASAAWGSYKYSQLVAVTADQAVHFLFLCTLPATLLPLAIMMLRRWVADGWQRW